MKVLAKLHEVIDVEITCVWLLSRHLSYKHTTYHFYNETHITNFLTSRNLLKKYKIGTAWINKSNDTDNDATQTRPRIDQGTNRGEMETIKMSSSLSHHRERIAR